VLERILLLRILPRGKPGSLVVLRIIQDLERTLSFSEEEHAMLKFEEKPGSLHWDPKAAVMKEVEFRPKAQAMIVEAIRELDEAEMLTMEWLGLCDKFGYTGIEDKGEQDDAEN